MLSAQRKPDEAHWQVLCELLLISSSVIMMLRTYAFSGKKKWVLAVLSITLLSLVGVIIWVSKKLSCLCRCDLLYQRVSLISNGITVSVLYLLVDRTGCFGLDSPTLTATGSILSKKPIGYHMGVRLGLGLGALV